MRDLKKCERCGKGYVPQSQAYETSRFCCHKCMYATLNGDKARDRIVKLHAKWAAETYEETKAHMRKYLEERAVKGRDPDDCWGWRGSIVKGVSVYATAKFRGKAMTAAKMSYLAYKDDELKKGETVSRTCVSPVCVNPNHLYVASRSEVRKCEFCDKEFTVKVTQPHRYCSDSCRNTVRTINYNVERRASLTDEDLWTDFKKRLESQIDKKKNGCWMWTGNVKKGMYPYGRIKFKGKNLIASRASWMIYRGDVEEGLCVCHICDNPKCVNPKHLYLGTLKDNSYDAVVRKRPGKVKLTEEDAVDIKKLIALGVSLSEIARRYGVRASTIGRIKYGKTWRDV